MGSSRSRSLDRAVKDVWAWSFNHNCWLSACHIPGVENVEADSWSRDLDSVAEWKLNPRVFDYVVENLGFLPVVDLMATRINTQLPKFMSFHPDPEAFAVDAFFWSWEDLDFYLFPPFVCISKILQKVAFDKARGILITPKWRNQLWYPHLCSMTVKSIDLPYSQDLLLDPSDSSRQQRMLDRLQLQAHLLDCKQQ
jgi:hypothetical protein